jgi:hypothetical protein
MSISFETITIRISKNHSALMRHGWNIGNVVTGERAVLGGKKSSFVFLKSNTSANACEATIGENCEVL